MQFTVFLNITFFSFIKNVCDLLAVSKLFSFNLNYFNMWLHEHKKSNENHLENSTSAFILNA